MLLNENYDEVMIERLVDAGMGAIYKASTPDITTPSEVISAVFTILDRMLGNIRRTQDPSDRIHNAKQISNALNDLLIDHGHVPH